VVVFVFNRFTERGSITQYLSRQYADETLVDAQCRLVELSKRPSCWNSEDPKLRGSDFLESLNEIRRLYTSSLNAYTSLASKQRCQNVERTGTIVGLAILESDVLSLLQHEEEKAMHRTKGDEYMDIVDDVLNGLCSPDILRRECSKIFSEFDKVSLSLVSLLLQFSLLQTMSRTRATNYFESTRNLENSVFHRFKNYFPA